MKTSSESRGSVFFLCPRRDLVRERQGYQRAFLRRGMDVFCFDDAPGAAKDLRAIGAAGMSPSWIIHPDPAVPTLPLGLTTAAVPTACFHIDSFVATNRRAVWSLLFDRVFVFHPREMNAFRASGHPGVAPLFHAAESDALAPAEAVRDLDIAIVGRTDQAYRARLACLKAIEGRFRTNEWWRPHSPDEVAALYRRAKIVVNVGRDDRPDDVGVRFGEAMIAGALFATILPTELQSLGFEEGTHFAGFYGPADIAEVCGRHLADDARRVRIATAGQRLVLENHTYDRRVAAIMEAPRALRAPGRRLTNNEVGLIRLDYFATKGRISEAWRELTAMGTKPDRTAARGAARLARALARRAFTVVRS